MGTRINPNLQRTPYSNEPYSQAIELIDTLDLRTDPGVQKLLSKCNFTNELAEGIMAHCETLKTAHSIAPKRKKLAENYLSELSWKDWVGAACLLQSAPHDPSSES